MRDPYRGDPDWANYSLLFWALGAAVAWSLACAGIGLGIGWYVWGR